MSHPRPQSREQRFDAAAARAQKREERKKAAVCPLCSGRKPVPQVPGLHSLMCKACWKHVPLELRKTNKRFSDRFRAAHHGATPLTPAEHKAWETNVAECRKAAIEARGL